MGLCDCIRCTRLSSFAVRLDFSGLDAAAKLRDRKNRDAWVSCCCRCYAAEARLLVDVPAPGTTSMCCCWTVTESTAAELHTLRMHLFPVCNLLCLLARSFCFTSGFLSVQEKEVLASIEEMRAELSRLAPNLKASTVVCSLREDAVRCSRPVCLPVAPAGMLARVHAC